MGGINILRLGNSSVEERKIYPDPTSTNCAHVAVNQLINSGVRSTKKMMSRLSFLARSEVYLMVSALAFSFAFVGQV